MRKDPPPDLNPTSRYAGAWLGFFGLISDVIRSSFPRAQNGTGEDVKKIVTVLNEAEVPSEDVVEVVVSPPFVFLPQVKGLLRLDFAVAAQNCWVRKGGAFTGEISAEMLVNLQVPWVIFGHSERRALMGESSDASAF